MRTYVLSLRPATSDLFAKKAELFQGRIDPPKAGRGHATPVQPVQRAKCWRLLNLEPRFEWYHVRARHNALIYRPFKETANVFLVTASILPSVLAVWELHALSPPSAGRYALGCLDERVLSRTVEGLFYSCGSVLQGLEVEVQPGEDPSVLTLFD